MELMDISMAIILAALVTGAAIWAWLLWPKLRAITSALWGVTVGLIAGSAIATRQRPDRDDDPTPILPPPPPIDAVTYDDDLDEVLGDAETDPDYDDDPRSIAARLDARAERLRRGSGVSDD